MGIKTDFDLQVPDLKIKKSLVVRMLQEDNKEYLLVFSANGLTSLTWPVESISRKTNTISEDLEESSHMILFSR